MTGFGQGFAQGNGVRLDVEISSVNRKQLDVLINLPRPLQTMESWILEQCSHRMSRGRVQVQVTMQSIALAAAAPVQVDMNLARHCLKELQQAAGKLGLKADLSLSELIRIPGVLMIRDAGQDIEKVKPVLQKALDRALRNFTAMRQREGESLRNDLAHRLDQLESHGRRITARAPGLVERYRQGLRDRIKQLAPDLAIADERLEREVVLFADRADISEELTRLSSHLGQARGMLRQKEPAGRSLDFLAQEMFREINTIASKAADTVISAAVVRMKAELERLREQVQNIE